MPIPQNAQAIYQFLTGHGYSANAAAGIVGNIEQESGGNPATPGGGLIQILSGGPGYTSNTSLAAQLQSILTYNNAQGASLIAELNAQSSPSAAALFYSQKFERPGIPDNANRQQSAIDVANAAKTGNWSAGSTNQPQQTSGAAGIFSWPADITGAFKDAKTFVDALLWIVNPASWLRIGSFFIGAMLILFAIWIFIKVGSDEPIVKMPSTIPIPV